MFMQVYVLLTDGTEAIIPKKAEKNNLWQGSISATSIVNQAGQYALFGGVVHHREDVELAAIREVSEELGVDIRQYNYKVDNY